MKDRVKLLLCAMVCITIIIFGILIWPTFYRYDKIGGKLPFRVNRITGYTEILYQNRGWEPVRNVRIIPQNELNKVTILGYFGLPEKIYKGEIYNGSSYTLKKIRLSIGGKYGSGKIEWQKTYETPVDIAPFSKGYCSIELIDMHREPPSNAKPIPYTGEVIPLPPLRSEVKLEEIFGYKGE